MKVLVNLYKQQFDEICEKIDKISKVDLDMDPVSDLE